MAQQEPGATFEATYECGVTGLVGVLAVRIDDNENVTVVGPQTTDILEIAGGISGTYSVVLVAPATVGQYTIVWSNDGSFDADAGIGAEDLLVAESILGLSPLPPLATDPDGLGAPCSAWTSREAVASCCPGFSDASTDDQDAAIRAASEILFEVADRLYPGECGPVEVRPCAGACGCWGSWSYGLDFTWDPTRTRWSCDTKACGCSPVSDVVLSGVPIRSIEEVLIDGLPLDPSEYGLKEPNRLVRLRNLAEPNTRLVWPGCQIEDLPSTEEGTFAISYTYGADPPQAGRLAAAALACQIFRACSTGEDCQLPEGVTQVVRQGISYEMANLAAAALKNGTTGVAAIDSFVGIFASTKGESRSSVWSPDLAYPVRYRDASGT